ncbi:peptide chain release factor N(5)-glutamine methyltransferase [Aquimarina sp. W85]|uniref:peptide chain release factor N(5)-glutamine methyltransferase n=1 Tax=Aquimarina rhodophyticola TaxID=3342246 RepID=UPI00366C8677
MIHRPVTIKTYREHFLNTLSPLYGIDEATSFFYILTHSYLGLSRAQVALSLAQELAPSDAVIFEKAVAQLKNQRPIQYILGETEFFSLPIQVDQSVLIPRPETEELVAWIISDLESRQSSSIKILDIGTGSGCIAVSLAKKIPKAEVFALDLSEKAIQIASKNARLNQVTVNFITADVTDDALVLPHKFDIIVSNPPYIRTVEKQEILPNVLNNEPHMALFVEDDDPLLFYRKITKLANTYLTNKGVLYFEINQYLGAETLKLISDLGFDTVELRKDIFTNDRMIRAKKKSK